MTQEGGYIAKQLSSSFQSVRLDKAGSDCGTQKYLDITLNEYNAKEYLKRYIVNSKGELILLTTENIDTYIGKKVKLRSPMFCLSKAVCSKCAGELYYQLGLENVGLTYSRVGTALLNMELKQKHDQTIKTTRISIFDYID